MNQTYLLHTPSSFFFRLTIPVDLRPLIGKRELRWSLKTGAVGIAKQKARLLAGNLHHLFRQLRQERCTVTDLTTDNIQNLIEDFKTQTIGTREDAKVMTEKPLTPRQITTDQCNDQECLELVTDQLARCDYGPVTEFATELLGGQGITFDKDGMAFKTFRRSILMAQQEIFDISIQRSQGFYSDRYATKAAKSPVLAPSAAPEPKSTTPSGLPAIGLRTAVEEWFKENTDAGNWRDRSIKEYRTTTNRVVEFFGEDKHPGFITEDLNLIGYIDKLRSQGETRLWPELPYMNNSYGHAASKWFETYRKRCGITSKKKVFHSFRHTLTDHLKQKMVNMAVVEEFTGRRSEPVRQEVCCHHPLQRMHIKSGLRRGPLCPLSPNTAW